MAEWGWKEKEKKWRKKKKGENSGASTWTFIADTHAASQIPRWEKEKKREQVLRGRKGGKKKKKGTNQTSLTSTWQAGSPPFFFFSFFLFAGNQKGTSLWIYCDCNHLGKRRKKERKKSHWFYFFDHLIVDLTGTGGTTAGWSWRNEDLTLPPCPRGSI